MDNRLIEKVEAYKNGLKLIQEIQPCTYHLRGKEKKNLGIISQDLQELEPALVKQDVNGVLTVDYEKLSIILINSIKELSNEIDSLKNKPQAQKNNIKSKPVT